MYLFCDLFKTVQTYNCSLRMNMQPSHQLDCSMLAAGLGLGLVAGLSFARLISTLMAALHVGSERLLADFDTLFGF